MTSKERHQLRYERRRARRHQKRQAVLPCHTYDELFTFDHLYRSYKKCRKGVSWKASVQSYRFNAIFEVGRVYNALRNRQYQLEPLHNFIINDRGKTRHIQSLGIRGRVVQKCLCDYYLTPLVRQQLIYDNAACLKGKGVSFALRRVKHHIRKSLLKSPLDNIYLVQFDIHDYFNSIDHEILYNLLSAIVEDTEINLLMYRLIRAFGRYKGLGLGSQIAQTCALLYQNKLDHILKERVRIKEYARFMDDGYAFCYSKEDAHQCYQAVLDCIAMLELEANPRKTHISKLKSGMTFLRLLYKVKQNDLVVRPCYTSVTRARRKIRHFQKRLQEESISPESVEQSYNSFRGGLKAKSCCYHILQAMDNYYTEHTGFVVRAA